MATDLKVRAAVLLTIFLAAACATSLGTDTRGSVPGLVTDLDRSVSACDDFYRFASGGWLASHTIPADAEEWGTIAQLVETNGTQVRELVEAAASKQRDRSPDEQRAGDFFAACMDETAVDAMGLQPIARDLQRIDAVHDRASLLEEIASLQAADVDVAFSAGSIQDSADARAMIPELEQGGLGLPDGSYYVATEERSQAIRDAYMRHVARLFELAGDDGANAARRAASVFALEKSLASGAMTRVQRRDPALTTHRMSRAELSALTPAVPWNAWFDAVAAQRTSVLNVAQPDFFRALDRALASVPLDDWKSYLRWQLLHRSAPELAASFSQADFEFYSATLNGTTAAPPRWKRCVRATQRALPAAVAHLYVERHFTPAARARATTMVDGIVAAFRQRLGSTTWLTDVTRTRAIEKLDAMGRKIGYPDITHETAEPAIDRTTHLANVLAASRAEFAKDLARAGQPLDRTQWSMSPQTPNASYRAGTNEIVVPAGVLQPPLWDPAIDDAYNYGAIGALIGHELTHAFDDRGAKFDAAGNLKDWWLAADRAEFERRAGCIAQQFEAYTVADVHENGRLVQGESIADLGGLTAALDAYAAATRNLPRRIVDGFTPEQRVFLGWARLWTANLRPEYARKMTLTNNHPIGKYRVNGTVGNMPSFATAFGCKAGDAMVRPPEVRCTVW